MTDCYHSVQASSAGFTYRACATTTSKTMTTREGSRSTRSEVQKKDRKPTSPRSHSTHNWRLVIVEPVT
jgi:hypothetical protein